MANRQISGIMQYMPELIGHQKQRGLFENILARGNLHHAYCFVGPKNIGKRTFAESLSARLLETTRTKLASAPDYYFLTRARDEKTGKLKKDISVEQMRGLISFIHQTPFSSGGYKVALIDEAEMLSIAAANAILKILEEPKGKTVLILVIADEKRILPTLMSRAQLWYFSLVPKSELFDYAQKVGVSNDLAHEMAEVADGRPGRMIQWLEDESAFLAHKSRIKQFWSLFGVSFHEKLDRVSSVYGDKKDHISARDELIITLDNWLDEVRRVLRQQYLADNKREEISQAALDPPLLLSLANILPEIQQNLKRNVHPRLLVEHLLLNIP